MTHELTEVQRDAYIKTIKAMEETLMKLIRDNISLRSELAGEARSKAKICALLKPTR